MEIRAKVALSLPNDFYKIILKYDTFEKATYDSYLVASIVNNTKTEKEAFKYIDEITGNGSLNPHFKKMYKEISQLSDEQVQNILNDSLFPITIVDKKNHFKYYPMLDITRMNDKVYKGNLYEQNIVKELIMPKDKNVKFLDLQYETEPGTLKKDNYNAIFSNTGIKIDMGDGNYYPISNDNFNKVYKNDIEDISMYEGKIGTEITNGNWFVLNNILLNSLKSYKMKYIDSYGNINCVFLDKLKKYEVIKVFSMYFYKETIIEYTLKNINECNEVVNYLLDSKFINEFKTKNLIHLLKSTDDLLAQKVINYILSRKDSKEISELGLSLIKNGLEKNWLIDTLISIKKYTSSNDMKYVYKLDSKNICFSIEDLLSIDDVDLNIQDKVKKQEYLDERDNMIQEIRRIIGEMTTSGVREKMKKLQKDSVQKALTKFMNEYIGHSKKSYDELTMEKLKHEYEYIQSMYNNYYLKIKNRIESEN